MLIDDIVADFYRNVGWITLPILLVLLVADIAIFRRALRPLRQASEIASHIGPTRTGLRLPTEEIPREVRPLVSAVNQALNRLEEGLRIQRDFTADAAHELRTPLAILRTRLDLLQDQKIGQALRQDVEGMAHIISQLLDIAELDAFVVDPSEKADLRAVTAEVAEFVAPLALAQGKDIALSGASEPVWVRGNPEMLARAIRNLAENAINHTAPATTVEFVVDAGRDGEHSRPGTGRDRGGAQADLSALLASRSQQGRQHGSRPFHRSAHRRTAFRDDHAGKPKARRRALRAQISPSGPVGAGDLCPIDPTRREGTQDG